MCTDAEVLAVNAVLDALTREGPYPPEHRAQLLRLRRTWPTLYHALIRLAEARHVALPPHEPGPVDAREILRRLDQVM